MPEPFRLAVQKALQASLEEISYDFGTQTVTLAGSVFRGRVVFGDDDPLPMVSILEEPIAPDSDLEPSTGSGGSAPYQLMVQGFVADDPANPTDPAHYLLAAVKAKLAELRAASRESDRVFQFGSKAPTVTGIGFGGGVVRPADEISAKAYFWLRVTLDLAEDHQNPYV